ncbi:hypothetical protein Bbelb_336350 [Branchiostoma belcheri]|nr:hypothetical protein Bbelb_336350 [Branchiostoma belcheri]
MPPITSFNSLLCEPTTVFGERNPRLSAGQCTGTASSVLVSQLGWGQSGIQGNTLGSGLAHRSPFHKKRQITHHQSYPGARTCQWTPGLTDSLPTDDNSCQGYNICSTSQGITRYHGNYPST